MQKMDALSPTRPYLSFNAIRQAFRIPEASMANCFEEDKLNNFVLIHF
jgi:hypothetical protein